jgi:hypothetical protein
MKLHRIDLIALLLSLATGATWWLGEGGHLDVRHGVVLAVLALAALKMLLIALDYMELWHAPAVWRRLVLAWLVLVVGLIAVVSLALPR